MKKFLTMFVFAIALVAFTGSVALANYGSDNSLYGQVRVNKTIKAIKKANVSLYTVAGVKLYSQTATKKGNYSFGSLTAGTYVVKAKMPGYHSPSSKKIKASSYTVTVNGATKQNLYLKK